MEWRTQACGPTCNGYRHTVDCQGNELADALAKEASELPQQDVPPDAAAVVKAVARDARKAWAASWRPSLHRDIMKGKIPAPVEEPTAAQPWTCISSGPATGRAPGNTCTGLENTDGRLSRV